MCDVEQTGEESCHRNHPEGGGREELSERPLHAGQLPTTPARAKRAPQWQSAGAQSAHQSA
eukprot:548559-Prorocentrum_lima.AAC.1